MFHSIMFVKLLHLISFSPFDYTVEQFSVMRLASLLTKGHELSSINSQPVIITHKQVHKAGGMSKPLPF